MKKKIIFMVYDMGIGGIEKALLNIIYQLSEDHYETSILMVKKQGDFLNQIPNHVKLKYMDNYSEFNALINPPPRSTFINLLNKRKIYKAFSFFTYYLISRIMKNKSIFYKYLFRNHLRRTEDYDIAVAFSGHIEFISYFILHKIKAKKKIQWIHFDVSKINFDKDFATKTYNKFDNIVAVSKESLVKLINIIPSIKGKASYFHNISSIENLKVMADYGRDYYGDFNGIKILTVARLSKEKGQDMAIQILAKLRSDGYNIKWYCIGEGMARDEYEKLIKHYNLENDFLLLGSNPNPYPFMKTCDLYVQPSRHEGYCITLAEAKCFNLPIVTTNFTGANEQIKNNTTGLIVNFNEEEMYNAVKMLLDDIPLKNNLINNLKVDINEPKEEINKLYGLF